MYKNGNTAGMAIKEKTATRTVEIVFLKRHGFLQLMKNGSSSNV